MKAAIDIGSNSLRLLVTEGERGASRVLRQDVEETRLGEGFDKGILTEASMERTLAVIGRWREELAAMGISAPLIFATSAVRDAANKAEFAAAVRSRVGLELRVLSGEEEAWYSFSGAVSGFDFPPEQCLLIDIGGGSTELAAYDRGRLKGVSFPVGAVRWQVMDFRREEVKAKFASGLTLNRFDGVVHYVGVGGTVTTAAAVLGEVSAYSREAIHGGTIDYAALTALKRRLAGMTLAERKQVTGMPPKRAEIILYGLEILEILFEVLNITTLHVSDYGILDGVLAEA